MDNKYFFIIFIISITLTACGPKGGGGGASSEAASAQTAAAANNDVSQFEGRQDPFDGAGLFTTTSIKDNPSLPGILGLPRAVQYSYNPYTGENTPGFAIRVCVELGAFGGADNTPDPLVDQPMLLRNPIIREDRLMNQNIRSSDFDPLPLYYTGVGDVWEAEFFVRMETLNDLDVYQVIPTVNGSYDDPDTAIYCDGLHWDSSYRDMGAKGAGLTLEFWWAQNAFVELD